MSCKPFDVKPLFAALRQTPSRAAIRRKQWHTRAELANALFE